MNNFEFYAPTKIVFGQNQIEQLPRLIPGNARVLIVYGQGSIKENGVYNQVMNALVGHVVFEFDGVVPNPDYDHIIKAIPLIKKHEINFILAVGGASTIDSAKFLSAAACFEGDPWEIVLSQGEKITNALPHGAVLTLPASGTEMNSYSVMTCRSRGVYFDFSHPSFFLQFAILDPSITFSLPRQQIVNGIVDAFVHVIEQYLTYGVDASLADHFAESLLLTLVAEGRRILDDPAHYAARANFMWAATIALNGLIQSGVICDWTTHKIAQVLSLFFNLDHGVALAVILPGVLKVLHVQKHAKLVRYGREVWGLKLLDENDLAMAAIQATEDFLVEIGASIRLRDLNIHKEEFARIADYLEQNGLLPMGERNNIHKAEVIKILEACY